MCTLTELTGKDLRDAVETMPKMYGIRLTTPAETMVFCHSDYATLKSTIKLAASVGFDMSDTEEATQKLEDLDVEFASTNPDACNVYYILNDGDTEYDVVQLDGEPFQITKWLADWNLLTLPE